MNKLKKSSLLLIVCLLFSAFSAFAYITYKQSETVSSTATECCKAPQPATGSELLWDVLSRQFTSMISLR
ncbi:MAG TPA: hypothetical protein VHK91_16995 [Flavisolibacter sp.]|jgi:hypothetical protein|nr:hypothetical protein [Flavisolibacter sp.]